MQLAYSKTSVMTAPQPGQTVSYIDMTDAELVVLCQKKDEKAFECLVRRHQRVVYAMLLRLAPDWNDTADLAQEVFVRVWKGIGNLRNPHAFKKWLSQVGTHLFYDELAKRPRRTPVSSLEEFYESEEGEGKALEIADHSSDPHEILERKEAESLVRKAIARLPERFRTMIVLRDLEDMTYEEIAGLTDTDLGTVKSRISRARTKVQQILQPHFPHHNRKLTA